MNQNFFEGLSLQQLEQMQFAAREVIECERVTRRSSRNMIHEVTQGEAKLATMQRYPEESIIDAGNHSRCYYHCHRDVPDEHGHMHYFIRSSGFPSGTTPVEHTGGDEWPSGDSAHAHLIAISLDKYGTPIKLFTTNAWVTDEVLFDSQTVQQMVNLLLLDHTYPSWAFNRWATALVYLFKPQINWLISQREVTLAKWQEEHPDQCVFVDRRIEILDEMKISVSKQITNVEMWLARMAKPKQNLRST